MYRIVWEYDTHAGQAEQFESVYGPEGRWAQFFRKSPDYVVTDLYRCTTKANRFVTVDCWRNRAAYEAFRKEHGEEFANLDEWCRLLVDRERTLGVTDDGKE